MAVANGLSPTFDEVHIGNSGTVNVVAQASTVTQAVVVNAKSGKITTLAQNLAAGAEVSFRVINDKCMDDSTVAISVGSGGLGNTVTAANVTAASAGSFIVTLSNLHPSVAQTGTLVLNFAIIN